MAEDILWVNASVDAETKRRVEIMADEDERSVSALMRVLINREWERRYPLPSTVSAETLPSPTIEARE